MCRASFYAAWLGLAALSCAAVIVPSPAAACGACYCYDEENWSSEYSVSQAPRNLRVLLQGADDQRAWARRASDNTRVELVVEPSGSPGFIWARASEPLSAEQDYTVYVGQRDAADDADAGEALARSLWFHVASDVDTTPIAVGRTDITATEGSGLCDLSWGSNLEVSSLDDGAGASGGRRVYVRVELYLPDGKQQLILPLNAYTQEQHVIFGTNAPELAARCLYGRYLAGVGADTEGTARVTFYDLAGNETVIDKALPVTFGSGKGGCPTTSVAAPSSADAGTPTTSHAGMLAVDSYVPASDAGPANTPAAPRQPACAVTDVGARTAGSDLAFVSLLMVGIVRRRMSRVSGRLPTGRPRA